MADRADTVPGFTMQSENFFLKFITGLQGGLTSKLLEYETDWYEVMEIILSRLQDEQENKERFEMITARDLEYWARVQPGGEALNLRIRAALEEKKYLKPPAGSRKVLRLLFNDRFSTQVLFHVEKKQFMRSLREISAVAVADPLTSQTQIKELSSELPAVLIPDVLRAFNDCWTARHYRQGMMFSCPSWCSCREAPSIPPTVTVTSFPPNHPQPVQPQQPVQPVLQPPQPQPLQAPQDPQPSTSQASKVNKKLPRKSARKSKLNKSSVEVDKKNKRKASTQSEEKNESKVGVKKCSRKICTKKNCRYKSPKSDTDRDSSASGNKQDTYQVLRKYKSQLTQLKSHLKSYLTVNVKRLEKNIKRVDVEDSNTNRKSARLSKLKERLLQFSQNKISLQNEDIFEPRPSTRSTSKGSALSRNKPELQNKFTESKPVKRNLRSKVLGERKRRRHS